MSPAVAWLSAVAAPVVAALVLLPLRPHVEAVPFTAFFSGAVLVAWVGGFRPALLAIGLSALLGEYLFLPPAGFSAGLPGLIATALFVATASLTAAVIAALRARSLERARLLEALGHEELRFEALFQSMPQLALVAGPDGGAELVNRPLLAYAGEPSPEALAGSRWLRLVHADELPQALERWTAVVRTGQAGSYPLRLRRHDGVRRWFLMSLAPLPGPAGGRWLAAATDIQDQKDAEQAQLEAVRARDAFLSVVSHELRTPLTAAQLQIQHAQRLVRRGGAVDAETLSLRLAGTAASVTRLNELVDALLDVSRIASGRLQLERLPLDLSRLAEEAALPSAELLRRQGARLRLELEPGLTVLGDRLRLEQVLSNLLSNALKYGEGKDVTVVARRERGRALLAVTDLGIGVAPEDQGRIFDRFERAVNPRHYGGLGLGLWLTRQLVEAGGGTVRVSSARGAGATFTVELPLAEPAAAAAPQPAAPAQAAPVRS